MKQEEGTEPEPKPRFLPIEIKTHAQTKQLLKDFVLQKHHKLQRKMNLFKTED
jgi:hypothetical protein